MKRGTKFEVQVDGRTFEATWVGKAEFLRWQRAAQRMQADNHRELHQLQQEYPPEVAPELHERDEDGNPTAQPWGALERQYELAMLVLSPTIGDEPAKQLFDEDPVVCFSLALEVMAVHRLDAKAPLPAGGAVREPTGSAPPTVGARRPEPQPPGA